ncbi:MAG TPA: hypothetical protein DDZ96_13590 [Porphyromonadaceae bacterium]|jgi:hypothetical protein|uniref:hypothetical protein n=1 Tax=Limibacterium fermenti TaxID=3229863 RepID=UPI000E8F4981|nr:hypothetical protein [Porphyromonadaceae bacterium]HBK30296.1 hypothetical protein [Porphyromonadaceae bacterium]HBL34827.1 hypothetical protein [Porphyromonadaceae bacterium]HBX20902.1 hypothetical protein [Porphyromonadaceae bacterium]HBX46384.1 hypothetical protein [Porphyromonadaceae bacterium]
MAIKKKTTEKAISFPKKTAPKGSFKTGADVIRELEEQGIKLGQGPKSKLELFWESIPDGAIEIVDMDAILQ